MLEQPFLFTSCSSIQFFNSLFVIYRTPCCTRGRTSHLILCDLWDTMPCQNSLLSFPTQPFLGKQRISLGVASISTICLCSHSLFTSHQKVLLGSFYLCVRGCYGQIYLPPLAGCELSMLIITLCLVRCIGHWTF